MINRKKNGQFARGYTPWNKKDNLKKPEYKGIKINKYIPNLENEIHNQINRRRDWMETALDLKEESNSLERRIISLLFILLSFAGYLAIQILLLLTYLLRIW